jgi:CobQ-like glutamine amidotransferase family enzyme
VSVYPDLLGTYGDGGNGAVLLRRAQRRGVSAVAVAVRQDEPVPVSGDIYLLGGGEDRAQEAAGERLRGRSGVGLLRAVDRGAVVLAVCAGYQLLGARYAGYDGHELPGLGLLDVASTRGDGRAVGELLAEPIEESRLPHLTGYENHAGRTTLGPAARPLARVLLGLGNGSGNGTEGARQDRIWATYLHGPVLARNPALADELLRCVVGELEPLADPLVDALRAERIAAALHDARRRRWRGEWPRRPGRVA